MAVSPTKLSAGQMGTGLAGAPPRDWAFLLTEANFYRSRDTITLVQTDVEWLPGSFVKHDGTLSILPADISGILCAGCSTHAGPRAATIISRDAEVTDAYLQYGAMDPKLANDALARLAIHVRQGVLPNVAGATFDAAVPGAIVSGIPHSPVPVPPATMTYPQPASYAPSTLEGTEPDMPAAGSPQPAPPTTSVAMEAETEAQRQERIARGGAPSPPPTTSP